MPMECPQCFFVDGDAADGRRCAVCGRSYRPVVNVYLGFVALVYLVFLRYVNWTLTGRMWDLEANWGASIFRWARWPVDVQQQPELIPILGGMLAVMVLVPVVISVLYGKRGGFLLAGIAVVAGPSVAVGMLLVLSAWLAGGWTLRTRSKAGSVLLGCSPVWIFALVASRPTETASEPEVVLPVAYYLPAIVAVGLCVIVAFGLLIPLARLRYNARVAGIALSMLCVAPIVAYALVIGPDELGYAMLERDLHLIETQDRGLRTGLFADTTVAAIWQEFLDDAREQVAERRAEGEASMMHVPGLPVETQSSEDQLAAAIALQKVQFEIELKGRLEGTRAQVLARCERFLASWPGSRHMPAVLYVMSRVYDTVVDTAPLRDEASTLPLRYDASRIRTDGGLELNRRLVAEHPDTAYAAVARVKLADWHARQGHWSEARELLADTIQRYRDEVDASPPDLEDVSVFSDLARVGKMLEARRRTRYADRQVRLATRRLGFLDANLDPDGGNEVLRAYLDIPLFEIPAKKRERLRELEARCGDCSMADNIAAELAALEPSVTDRLEQLRAVSRRFAGTDGAAEALFTLADLQQQIEGPEAEQLGRAIATYKELLRQYPDSHLARSAERRLGFLQGRLRTVEAREAEVAE